MIKQRLSYVNAATLLLAIAIMAFHRGGDIRIYWLPAASLIIIATAVMLISASLGHIRMRPNARTDIPLLAFLGWCGFTWFASVNREQTAFEVYRLSIAVMAYMIAAYGISGNGPRLAFLVSIFVMALLEAFYGIYSYLSGSLLFDPSWIDMPLSKSAVTGTYLNHNHFAGLMYMSALSGLGLVGYAWSVKGDWSQRLSRAGLPLIGCAVLSAALVLSVSRGGWISMAFGVMIFLLSLFLSSRPRLFMVLGGALLAVIILSVVVIGIDKGEVGEQASTLQALSSLPEDLSASQRISIWKSTVEMIKDHPVTGTGWGTFRSVFPMYRQDRLFLGVRFAHNDYLQFASETGITGILLFLVFLAFLLYEGSLSIMRDKGNSLNWIYPGIVAAISAVLVHELVDFNLMVPSNSILFFSLAGLIAGRKEKK